MCADNRPADYDLIYEPGMRPDLTREIRNEEPHA